MNKDLKCAVGPVFIRIRKARNRDRTRPTQSHFVSLVSLDNAAKNRSLVMYRTVGTLSFRRNKHFSLHNISRDGLSVHSDVDPHVTNHSVGYSLIYVT